jgi:hypothetical protein
MDLPSAIRASRAISSLTAQRTLWPNSLQQDPPDIVIVTNAEYQREICCVINGIGIGCEVVSA